MKITAAPTPHSDPNTRRAPPMTVMQADRILIHHFNALHVTSDDVYVILLALIGALVPNTRCTAFREELEGRLRTDAFLSVVAQSQPGFYKNISALLRAMCITDDPLEVARNVALVTRFILTVWPSAGPAITHSYRRIKRRKSRDLSRPSLEDLLERLPLNREHFDQVQDVLSDSHPSAVS